VSAVNPFLPSNNPLELCDFPLFEEKDKKDEIKQRIDNNNTKKKDSRGDLMGVARQVAVHIPPTREARTTDTHSGRQHIRPPPTSQSFVFIVGEGENEEDKRRTRSQTKPGEEEKEE